MNSIWQKLAENRKKKGPFPLCKASDLFGAASFCNLAQEHVSQIKISICCSFERREIAKAHQVQQRHAGEDIQTIQLYQKVSPVPERIALTVPRLRYSLQSRILLKSPYIVIIPKIKSSYLPDSSFALSQSYRIYYIYRLKARL